MPTPIFDDGTFKISSAGVSTPHRFYPLANTAVGIRRDPLWIGAVVAACAAGCTLAYGDLFYPVELAVIAGVGLVSLIGGSSFSLLRLDAPGQRRAHFFGLHSAMRRRFEAICDARTPDIQAISIVE